MDWGLGTTNHGQQITDYNPLYTKCVLCFHAPTEHFILAQGSLARRISGATLGILAEHIYALKEHLKIIRLTGFR